MAIVKFFFIQFTFCCVQFRIDKHSMTLNYPTSVFAVNCNANNRLKAGWVNPVEYMHTIMQRQWDILQVSIYFELSAHHTRGGNFTQTRLYNIQVCYLCHPMFKKSCKV